MTLKNKEVASMTPRFAGAVLFSIFAILVLLFTKYMLLSIRESTLISLWPSLIFAIAAGLLTGVIFGNILAKESSWSRNFLIGIGVACFILLLISFAVLAHFYLTDSTLLHRFQHWQDHFVFYGVILVTLFLTLGLWLIPLTALVCVYFNKRFWPGLVAVEKKRHPLKKDNDITHE